MAATAQHKLSWIGAAPLDARELIALQEERIGFAVNRPVNAVNPFQVGVRQTLQPLLTLKVTAPTADVVEVLGLLTHRGKQLCFSREGEPLTVDALHKIFLTQ